MDSLLKMWTSPIAISWISFAMADVTPVPIEPSADMEAEKNVIDHHKTDSLTILMLLGLLLLTILTVWLFKHKRFRFVHETGLSIIYGLIIGAVIRYTSHPNEQITAEAYLKNYSDKATPEVVYIRMNVTTSKNKTSEAIVKYNADKIVTVMNQEALLEKTVTFDPEIFFNVFLPVIIFEAGYSMKKVHFFKNFGAIVMYAFIGTTLSFMVVGGLMFAITRVNSLKDAFTVNDCFFFGAIISATDPVTILAIFNDLNVDVTLYALVFGESVLNDAVAIVLSGSVEEFRASSVEAYNKGGGSEGFNTEAFFKALLNFAVIFGGAFLIGSVYGMVTAVLTKFTKLRDFPVLETALFFLMSYASFLTSETAGLTGIVAALFCGICQAHYTYNNLSDESKLRTKQLFELMNFMAENFVFLYIGVSVFTFENVAWNGWFIVGAFVAVIIGRAINIYPLSFLLNFGRRNKISLKMMHMMMFSGLRGAISYALAIRNTSSEARKHMLSATMMIVLITVIFCGGFVTPALQFLQIRVGVEEEETGVGQSADVRNAMSRQRQYSTMEVPRGMADHSPEQPSSLQSQAEQDIQSRSFNKAFLVAKWYKFDRKFLKPLLTNSRPSLMETCPSCCLPLTRLLTTQEQLESRLSHDGESDTDMIIDHSELSIGENHSTNTSPALNADKDHTEDVADVDLGANNFDSYSDDLPLTP
ncbi:sodium/hydrogen exchanger 9-like isoform X3 [Dreissena polymorpha]|uniref:sodium/hydrogen exchanger 9-like isoform X3 n=1 Tax=Dreissena polymorpha TaxID=45954 RepID=UPI002264D3A3|nr:sodium/hydrogen exchanger 9-like isoform X3 [Dreissena polymorpha]XP_052215847.1 sodium/hydrogen exchanger 9-like isoform X3 [Dreissena polymorpha]XP_052215848.1 sodium/hydrogen exchanger 9-like isoform X3 [Dreissena polymorpha]